ncbi:calcium-binding protein [Ideonella sp.]|uniref:calcium-binding protein n=1 Tax=Ideonella sp. TaxID=1929293 RepID=UPI0035AFE5B1
MNNTIADYQTYVNLQMFAEATGITGTEIPTGLGDWADKGNERASRTPLEISRQMVDQGWVIADHKKNTGTGFSGTLFYNTRTHEYVMSCRSTEFIDDAVRDNKATNDLEIKATGFAVGQLADLEKWYAEKVRPLTGGANLTVTGYSLGGHLATAFEQMHRSEVGKVYTINGAGVGQVLPGHTLKEVIDLFESKRDPASDLGYLFTTPAAKALYEELRPILQKGGKLTNEVLVRSGAMGSPTVITDALGNVIYTQQPPADCELLHNALSRIKAIQDEIDYVAGISNSPGKAPKQISAPEIEGLNLNYQIAALYATTFTHGLTVSQNAENLWENRGPRDEVRDNIVDILADSRWSAVSHSNYHHGTSTPVFIEDQPDARGLVVTGALFESLWNLGVKLLVDNFSKNDFGDTHSLVLLQDSLAVQQALAKLDPALAGSLAALSSVLKSASNSSPASHFPTQGQCDGDTLESAVDGLTRLLVNPLAKPTDSKLYNDSEHRDRNEGGTWASIDDRNHTLHASLSALVASDAFRAIQGQVQMLPASIDLAGRAIDDFSALACLLSGSPITIKPNEGALPTQVVELALAKVWGNDYQNWVGDHQLSDKQREAGLANFSFEYLQDRAAYLTAAVQANLANAPATAVSAILPQAILASDVSTGREVTVIGRHPPVLIQFGSSDAESLGPLNDPEGDNSQHLYGGAGADTVTGGQANDRLEGNAGDDVLNGQRGDDTLTGGFGKDTYVFDGSYGLDVVIDSDWEGGIRVNGQVIAETRCAGNSRWVAKLGDGKLLVLEVIDDSRSLTGKSLSIHAETGFDGNAIIVRNFDLDQGLSDEGYLGIKLEPQRALVIAAASSGTSLAPLDNGGGPFDVDNAWDFNKDNVQTVKAEAAERTGQNFTIYLNQGASEGDTLTIKVAGSAGKTKLIADGKVIEISGDTVLELEEGQTELSFALIGADAIDADKTLHVTATWQSTAALGMNRLAAAPAESNALDLTLKDNGAVVGQYFGDVRAPIDDKGRYEWEKTTWQPFLGGYLEHGEAEAGFNDVISSNGGQRVDEMDGKGGNDALDGGGGNDQIKGSDGNDLLAGGAGHDYLQGGDGNDVILSSSTLAVYSPVNTHDPDWAAVGGLKAWAKAETWGVYDPYVGGAIRPTYQQPDGTEYSAVSGDAKDTSGDVVEGGAGNDLVAGSWGDDAIFGDTGDDNLRGLAGDDALSGGAGDDWMAGDGIDYAGHIETVMGADQGYDQMDGGAGNDTMSGDAMDDALTGGDGNDEMYGDWSLFVCDFDRLDGIYHGDDELDGGAGDDKISGDGGHDTLIGGLGSDTLRGDAAFTGDDALDGQYHGMDSLDGGEGNDKLYGDGEADWLEGGDGNDQLLGDSKDTKVEFHGSDSLDGGVGNDTLQGDGGNDWLFGGEDAGDDQLRGDSDDIDGADHGADTLDGGDGADLLTGDGGQDSLIGGDGNDQLYGDNATLAGQHHGADVLEGGAGNDQLTGGGKADTLDGGEGDDRMWGDDASLGQEFHGNDDMDGGAGNDTLQGQWGDDTVLGGEGDDWVAGGDESSIDGTSTMGGDDAVFGEAGNDTVLGGLGNDTLSGGDGDDVLVGGVGDDVLEGGSGSDVLMGGEGNDSYYIDTTGLTIGVAERISDTEGSNSIYIRGSATQVDESGGDLTLTFGEGQQLIIEGGLKGGASELYFVGDSSQGETQSAQAAQTNDATGFAEWLQLNFWKPVSLIAATGTSALYGGSGNDTLTASTGTITLNGGWGDDQYFVKKAGQVVVEYDHGGVDKVTSDVSFTLGAAIENLVLTATAGSLSIATGNAMDNEITGNSSSNKLYGLDGNDTLDGGLSTDTMEGGAGNDTYVLSSTSDIVTEALDAGNDTIKIGTSASLLNIANVENLTLTSGTTGTGNALNNVLTGNTSSNQLYGREGNDTLDGGASTDTMEGGLGDDVYVMSSTSDKTTELAGGGNDTVQFAGTVDLTLAQFANIENATLLEGTGTFNLIGTTGDNVLIGNTSANTITGNAGKDTLIGGGGEDVLQGGADDDTYFVDSEGDQIVEATGAGTDTVLSAISWTLGATLENLTLAGGAWVDAIGNANVNTLTGNDGNNVLNGQAGNDVMIGGLGDDTYKMDAGDTLTEQANGGADTIVFAGTLDLSLPQYANFENLTLDGSGNFSGTGNAAANVITGNAGINTLKGGEGSDTLDGGLGNDAMEGGAGDDTYVMDSQTDQLTEAAGQGIDTVLAAFDVTLSGSFGAVENVTLTGTGDFSATGNTANNRLVGNSGKNTLAGDLGADTLVSGGGQDTLKGGKGDDIYQLSDASASVQELSGQGLDTVETSVTLSGALAGFVENLTLVGDAAINGTGNTLDNSIAGNAASNVIDGGLGNDAMRGGAGDDTYILNAAGDTVTEFANEGTDIVKVAASWTLTDNVENGELTSTGAFTLTGNALDNVLKDNGGGDDKLVGGAGNDVYELTTAGVTVSELVGGGTQDTVKQWFSSGGNLANEVENLVLLGTAKTGKGNALANQLIGNDSDNTLTGLADNDTLFGGGGNDKLIGGAGDDLYVFGTGDTITELANEGVDTVQSEISASLAALSTQVERLELTGSSAIDATGNDLDNELVGNDANNRLNGGAGVDRLEGGAGNDTYVVDSLSDVIVEGYGQGADSVESTISFSLDSLNEVENLVLKDLAVEGTGNDLNNQITGNGQANTLRGGAGDDTLDGGAGVDVLDGGAGNDTYIIGAAGLQQQARPRIPVFEYEDFAFNPWRAGDGLWTHRRVAIPVDRAQVSPDGQLAAQDTINELADGGIDTVKASVTINALGDNIENLVLTGAGKLNGTGNTLNNLITGTTGDNILSGLGGNDTLDGNGGTDQLKGGAGDDTYVLHSTNDVVTEVSDAGTDTVEANFTISTNLASYVENLTLTGVANIDGNGNALDNLLTGNDGNNRLDGKAGNDRMIGGKGDDTYVLSALGDQVVEQGDGYGNDTVEAGFTLTLTDVKYTNIENVLLTGGNIAIDATGNDGNNRLTGNKGVNKLVGAGGNDTLDGGLANDVLDGGLGDDTYVLDTVNDTVTEAVNAGTDTLSVAFSISLLDAKFANVENITLTGSQAIAATGNSGINTLTGNDAANVLDGGLGVDVMAGGKGDDTYVLSETTDRANENANEGTDTITSGTITLNLLNTWFANVENATLTGSANLSVTGNAGANVLTGNAGANSIGGGDGNDTLIGGAGSDQLFGQAGNDELIDDLGAADTLEGGAGTDVYRVGAASAPGATRKVQVWGHSEGDVVCLAAGILPEHVTKKVVGSSLVLEIHSPAIDLQSFTIELANQYAADGLSQISEVRFVSAPDVVWAGGDLNGVKQVGTAGDDVLQGSTSNTVPDMLLGLDGNDSLYGFEGNDTLIGGRGNDWMCGHDGNDVFEIGADAGNDLVWEHGDDGQDTVRFVEGIRPADLQLFRLGGDLEGQLNAEDSLVFRNAMTGAETWLREFFQLDGTCSVERFEFSDGTVWTYADILARVGTAPTVDAMVGTAGDDVFVVDDVYDTVQDNKWGDHDTIRSSISLTVPANVERLELTGVLDLWAYGDSGLGRTELVGNDGDNLLDGKDNQDTMAGGLGDDTYVDRDSTPGGEYSPAPDHIIEAVDAGHDVLKTNHAYRDLEANVEDMIVQYDTYYVFNRGDDERFDREYHGNALGNYIRIDVDDSVRSRVDGGAGADTMVGSSGNQTFTVDRLEDSVVDVNDHDHDYVSTNITYTLPGHIEGLLLTGTTAVSGYGTDAANLMDATANSAANHLYAGLGDDVYRLGAGDVVHESAGQGLDTVVLTSASIVVDGVVNVSTFANCERLVLDFQVEGDIVVTGDGNANAISGPAGSLQAWQAQVVLDGGAGDDLLVDQNNPGYGQATLSGGAGNDTLVSGVGRDWLDGGAGSDTYELGQAAGQYIRLGRGSGSDVATLLDSRLWDWTHQVDPYNDGRVLPSAQAQSSTAMVVQLDADIDTATLRFNRSGSALAISLGGADQLEVRSFFESDTSNNVVSSVGWLQFGGAFIAGEQMAKAVGKSSYSTATAGDDLLIAVTGVGATQSGGDGNDYIAGGAVAQQQEGGKGRDTLVAGDGNDTLVGGTGNDVLCGGRGSDRYVFSAGWGHDTLNESNMLGFGGVNSSSRLEVDGAPNVIAFDSSVSESDLTLEWDWAGGLYIRNKTGDEIFVSQDSLSGDSDPDTNTNAFIDRIEFANGTVWDRHKIETVWRTVEGTAGDDNLHDNAEGNLVLGYGGNDTLTADFVQTELYGGDGDDTLTTTVDSGPFGDRIYMYGEAGNDSITGGAFYDWLDGGTGTDTMSGGEGDDDYYVDIGADLVIEASNGGYDSVYATCSVSLASNVEWLQLESSGGAINGTGNALNNWIEGNEFANSLIGGAGSGRDTLIGGAGNDTFEAGGVDMIAGMDTMIGGTGADTYYFTAPAAASDTIQEFDSDGVGETSAVHDKVWFGNKALDAFYFWRDGDDLLVTWKDSQYSGSKLRIDDWYLSTDYQVEEFVFANGSMTKTAAEIEALAKPYPGTSLMSESPGRRRFGDPSSELLLDQNGGHRHPLDASRLIQAMACFDSSGALHASSAHLPWAEPLVGRPVDVAVHTLLV